jgi:hypothetical protein
MPQLNAEYFNQKNSGLKRKAGIFLNITKEESCSGNYEKNLCKRPKQAGFLVCLFRHRAHWLFRTGSKPSIYHKYHFLFGMITLYPAFMGEF